MYLYTFVFVLTYVTSEQGNLKIILNKWVTWVHVRDHPLYLPNRQLIIFITIPWVDVAIIHILFLNLKICKFLSYMYIIAIHV